MSLFMDNHEASVIPAEVPESHLQKQFLWDPGIVFDKPGMTSAYSSAGTFFIQINIIA